MGVRLYNPDSGRFDQTDPIPGGSANPYDYANQDPVNGLDLDGRLGTCNNKAKKTRITGRCSGTPKFVKWVARNRGQIAAYAVLGFCVFSTPLGCALASAAAYAVSVQQTGRRPTAQGVIVNAVLIGAGYGTGRLFGRLARPVAGWGGRALNGYGGIPSGICTVSWRCPSR